MHFEAVYPILLNVFFFSLLLEGRQAGRPAGWVPNGRIHSSIYVVLQEFESLLVVR